MALKKEAEEDIEAKLSTSSAWSISYGDLMSSMMIFFMILFASYFSGGKTINLKKIEKQKHVQPVEKQVQEVRNGVSMMLKTPAFLPYDRENAEQSVDYVLSAARKKGKEIKLDANVDVRETRKGLYRPNWVTKVVLVVETKGDNDYYLVKKGDNLWNISGKYLSDPFKYRELAKMNELKNPSRIGVGSLIKMPVETEKEGAPAPSTPVKEPAKAPTKQPDSDIKDDQPVQWL